MTTEKQTTPRKAFSMIREFHLADWFTLANAVCGVGALFSTMSYLETGLEQHIYFACALVLAALIFDILDGRIARWRQKPCLKARAKLNTLRAHQFQCLFCWLVLWPWLPTMAR